MQVILGLFPHPTMTLTDQDVLELRQAKWVARREVAGPKTIDQIRADIEKEQLNAKLQAMAPSGPMPGRRVLSLFTLLIPLIHVLRRVHPLNAGAGGMTGTEVVGAPGTAGSAEVRRGDLILSHY